MAIAVCPKSGFVIERPVVKPADFVLLGKVKVPALPEFFSKRDKLFSLKYLPGPKNEKKQDIDPVSSFFGNIKEGRCNSSEVYVFELRKNLTNLSLKEYFDISKTPVALPLGTVSWLINNSEFLLHVDKRDVRAKSNIFFIKNAQRSIDCCRLYEEWELTTYSMSQSNVFYGRGARFFSPINLSLI